MMSSDPDLPGELIDAIADPSAINAAASFAEVGIDALLDGASAGYLAASLLACSPPRSRASRNRGAARFWASDPAVSTASPSGATQFRG